MSNNPSPFTPEDSDELRDSETGELIYSPKKTIWSNNYSEANTIQKLQMVISSLGGRIKINTPPPPSPDFLSNVYFQQKFNFDIDFSKFEDFEDFIQKNMDTKTSFDNENFRLGASVGNEYKNSLIPPDVYAKYIKENPQFYPSYHFSKF
jgi:hypothetical protein